MRILGRTRSCSTACRCVKASGGVQTAHNEKPRFNQIRRQSRHKGLGSLDASPHATRHTACVRNSSLRPSLTVKGSSSAPSCLTPTGVAPTVRTPQSQCNRRPNTGSNNALRTRQKWVSWHPRVLATPPQAAQPWPKCTTGTHNSPDVAITVDADNR